MTLLKHQKKVATVSIITPVFNGERYILRAAESVLKQSWGNWEWVIVDDGSTDSTAALLESLDDRRIMLIRQLNLGVSSARNIALEHASGEYVTFLDADDTLPPDALQVRADYLDQHPNIDIVNGAAKVLADGKFLRRYLPDLEQGPLLSRLARLEEGVFFGVNYMLRRVKINSARFPDGVSHCEDIMFFMALAHDAELRYGAVDHVIYEYRIQPDSATSSLDGIESGYLELLRRGRRLNKLSAEVRRAQVKRVERILFRSWLRKGRLLRALSALRKIRRVARG